MVLLAHLHMSTEFVVTHQVTHQVEASPKGGLAQPQEINSQNMTVHVIT